MADLLLLAPTWTVVIHHQHAAFADFAVMRALPSAISSEFQRRASSDPITHDWLWTTAFATSSQTCNLLSGFGAALIVLPSLLSAPFFNNGPRVTGIDAGDQPVLSVQVDGDQNGDWSKQDAHPCCRRVQYEDVEKR